MKTEILHVMPKILKWKTIAMDKNIIDLFNFFLNSKILIFSTISCSFVVNSNSNFRNTAGCVFGTELIFF